MKRIILDSKVLHQGCSSTDPDVQAEAYETLWAYLYRVALQLTYDQPNAEDMAQDCAQSTLIRIHERLNECEGPTRFLRWARAIVTNMTIDELRRNRRLLPSDPDELEYAAVESPSDTERVLETLVFNKISIAELRDLIEKAPISKRSRRVILGRFLDNHLDEILAQKESELAGRVVLPDRIQVTRAKNFSTLRNWELITSFLSEKG